MSLPELVATDLYWLLLANIAVFSFLFVIVIITMNCAA
jgi:hypothetical protein